MNTTTTAPAFPSLTGITTYAKARAKRISADGRAIRECGTAQELAATWRSMEGRGFHTTEERACVLGSMADQLALLAG